MGLNNHQWQITEIDGESNMMQRPQKLILAKLKGRVSMGHAYMLTFRNKSKAADLGLGDDDDEKSDTFNTQLDLPPMPFNNQIQQKQPPPATSISIEQIQNIEPKQQPETDAHATPMSVISISTAALSPVGFDGDDDDADADYAMVTKSEEHNNGDRSDMDMDMDIPHSIPREFSDGGLQKKCSNLATLQQEVSIVRSVCPVNVEAASRSVSDMSCADDVPNAFPATSTPFAPPPSKVTARPAQTVGAYDGVNDKVGKVDTLQTAQSDSTPPATLEMMEDDAEDYKVVKILRGIHDYVETESDENGKGLLATKLRSNECGSEFKRALKFAVNDVWYLCALNYEDATNARYTQINQEINASFRGNACCILSFRKKPNNNAPAAMDALSSSSQAYGSVNTDDDQYIAAGNMVHASPSMKENHEQDMALQSAGGYLPRHYSYSLSPHALRSPKQQSVDPAMIPHISSRARHQSVDSAVRSRSHNHQSSVPIASPPPPSNSLRDRPKRYSDYRSWRKYPFQDPDQGKHYYAVSHVNVEQFPSVREPHTLIKIQERSLAADALEEKDEPGAIVHSMSPAPAFAAAPVTPPPPVFDASQPPWDKHVVSHNSQYSYDSTASCTIMGLEAAMRFQLEHKHFATRIESDLQKIDNILRVASLYKSAYHTDVDDVMHAVSWYREHLVRERCHQINVPRWKELTEFVVRMAQELVADISCVVTKPPETIFVHFCFPFLDKNDYSYCTPLLFDSHARPERGLRGAHMLRFENFASFYDYLSMLWPKVPMDADANLLQTQVNIVNIDVITLDANLRRKPKLNLKKLQQEFDALAATFRTPKQSPAPLRSPKQLPSSSGIMSATGIGGDSFGFSGQQTQNPKMSTLPAAQLAASVAVGETDVRNPANFMSSSYNEYGTGVASFGFSGQQSQQKQNPKMSSSPSAQFAASAVMQNSSNEYEAEKSDSRIEVRFAAYEKRIAEAEATIQQQNQRIENQKQFIKDKSVELRKMTEQHIALQTEYDSLLAKLSADTDDAQSQVKQTESKRQYLVQQMKKMRSEKQEMEQTHATEISNLKTRFEREQTEWKNRETSVFNSYVQQINEQNASELQKRDQQIEQRNAETQKLKLGVAALEAELKPYRDEKRRIEELNRTFTCAICTDEFKVQGDCFMMDCGHMLDRECAIHCFKTLNIQTQKKLPYCPECSANHNMTTKVKEQQLELLGDHQLMEHYYALSAQLGMSGLRIFHCPTPDCQFSAEAPENLLQFQCNVCGQSYCPKCKRTYHHRETCEEYAQRKCKEEQMSEQQLEELAKKMGWKQCPKCHVYVERTFGCYHMKCKNPQCNAEFCDGCGAELDPNDWQKHFNPPSKCELWSSTDPLKDLLDPDNQENDNDDEKNNE